MSLIPPMKSSIIDLTLRPESPKVHQQFKATATETTTKTTTLPPPPYQQQSTAEAMMMKRIDELEHIMANLIQENKGLEERLEKHGARLYTLEQLDIPHQVSKAVKLTQDLAKARKKKKKSRESSKTPPGSLPHQPPYPPSPAGPLGASGAPRASGSSQVPPPPPPPSSTNQENEDMALDEQAQSSDEEDIRSAHIPKVNLRQDWWKPLEEERPATLEPAWSIPSSDVPVPTNNWASALASNYSPPPEDSLLAQTGDIATFMDWFYKRQSITEFKPQDLEGPAFEIIKVFHPDVIHLQYQMEECHKLLTDSVDDSILRHNVSKPLPLGGPPEECKYDIAVMYGISHWWFQRQRFYIDRHTSEGDHSAVRTHMQILSVVRIEDKYGVQMMMRFNEIHKFSDGTLQQIDEALDYRVKEFRINRMNPGLNTRFWTRKDVDRSKAFMFAIQKRLKTRRIFRNLKSFVGGRVREGDYRLLKRTK
uniref:Uncharacterized protein n=1 Tax=Tanacetum cinerariifolium TaxID=118510 RepID=A0A6L2LN50_TANCI|nr:hypothetical protein [Tanacetum cinerariifolium]